MGTNYHHHPAACEHCGETASGPLHIGKSSAGWVFALHINPEIEIRDLADWEARWASLPDDEIRDEYGRVLTPEQMRSLITERGRQDPPGAGFDYESNHAEPGPNNLVRSKVDGERCVGHGAGTWDLFVGDFS